MRITGLAAAVSAATVLIAASGGVPAAWAQGTTAPIQSTARIAAGRFAVKEFQTADGLGSSFYGISAIRISNAVADMLATEMGNAGFDLLERARLADVLEEQNLGSSGRANKATAARTGDIAGAQFLLVGTITEWGVKEQKAGLAGFVRGDIGRLGGKKSEARVAINYRVVDAATGRVLTVGEAKGSQDNFGITVSDGWYRGGSFNESEWAQSQIGKATRKAVSGIAKQLKAKYPATKGTAAKAAAVEAGVVSVLGADSAIIDGGEAIGLKPGDTLEILRFTEVKDKNGLVVYREETKIGTAQVLNVQPSGAKIKITLTESGQKVEAGDTVRVRRN